MLRRLVLPALLAIVACSSDSTTAPDRLSMAGAWRQSGDLRDPGTGDTLIYLGKFNLVQSDATFSGSGWQGPTCSPSGQVHQGPLADPIPFAVTDGALMGRTVTFKRDICSYAGTFADGTNNRITGTAICQYSRNGVDYSFSGQWQADKE